MKWQPVSDFHFILSGDIPLSGVWCNKYVVLLWLWILITPVVLSPVSFRHCNILHLVFSSVVSIGVLDTVNKLWYIKEMKSHPSLFLTTITTCIHINKQAGSFNTSEGQWLYQRPGYSLWIVDVQSSPSLKNAVSLETFPDWQNDLTSHETITYIYMLGTKAYGGQACELLQLWSKELTILSKLFCGFCVQAKNSVCHRILVSL